jgi:hypothetical protein
MSIDPYARYMQAVEQGHIQAAADFVQDIDENERDALLVQFLIVLGSQLDPAEKCEAMAAARAPYLRDASDAHADAIEQESVEPLDWLRHYQRLSIY